MDRGLYVRLLTVVASIAVVAGIGFQNAGATSFRRASIRVAPIKGKAVLHGLSAPSVRAHTAQFLGPAHSRASMAIDLSLPMRDQAAANAFIAAEARGQAPMSQAEFDSQYGASKSQINSVLQWAISQGLRVNYVSPDGLTIGVDGPISVVDSALHVRINRYRFNGRQFISNSGPPILPARLGISTIMGLNTFDRFVRFLRRSNVRPGGFHPVDLRNAYNVDGSLPTTHTGSGSGQVIGFTDFGGNVIAQSNFKNFHTRTGDTAITTCAITSDLGRVTFAPTPVACTGPGAADTIQWVYVGGKNKDNTGDAQLEAALDVEYAHGMAPRVHMKYFFANDTINGGNDTGTYLTDALSQAANDPTLHIVSNSWGGWVSGSRDSFVKSTRPIFMHAVMVGTTFYFATGDSASDSGCKIQSNGTPYNPLCGKPSYPATSPFVAAVGGTYLSMDSTYTTYDKEAGWNFLEGFTRHGQAIVSGGGGGCASYFYQPPWQKNVPSIADNETCKGRAEPDVAADADPASGVIVAILGHYYQVGGTSLSAPLWAGMMADSDNYITTNALPHLTGWVVPKLYQIGGTPQYNAYFHDTTCGYNGYPDAAGWDEATGWGSPNWYPLTVALGGTASVSNGNLPTICKDVTAASVLRLPFTKWPSGTQSKTGAESAESTAWLDEKYNNFFRQFHKTSYSSHRVLGAEAGAARIKIGKDKSPIGYYLATYYNNNTHAAGMSSDGLEGIRAHHIANSNCSIGLRKAGDATPDCHVVAFVIKSGATKLQNLYGLYSVGNVMVAFVLELKTKTFNIVKDQNHAVADFFKLSTTLIGTVLGAEKTFQPNDDAIHAGASGLTISQLSRMTTYKPLLH